MLESAWCRTGLATPLAALDPIASNAFGIVQSVVTVG
jgi:hypothetical protein